MTVALDHAHTWTWQGRALFHELPNCEHPERLACECGADQVVRCNSTSSDRCEPCGKSYRRRVRLVAIHGSTRVPGGTTVMITLTAPGNGEHRKPNGEVCRCTPAEGVHLPSWNARAGRNWNRYCQAMRRLFGVQLEYFKAAEIQRRGAIHYHVLVRFPVGVKLNQGQLRELAIDHGFGHSIDVQIVVDERQASYCAKYAAKAVDARSEIPWVTTSGEIITGNGRFRVWTASRHWGLTMATLKAAQRHWANENAGDGDEEAQRRAPAPLDHNSQRYTAATDPPAQQLDIIG